MFNAVFLVLAMVSGAAPPLSMFEGGAGVRPVVLVAAFVGAALVTPRLLAWIGRWRAWPAGKTRLTGALWGCAVVVLSSIIDVEASGWAPSRGRRVSRPSERASWSPAGSAWRARASAHRRAFAGGP